MNRGGRREAQRSDLSDSPCSPRFKSIRTDAADGKFRNCKGRLLGIPILLPGNAVLLRNSRGVAGASLRIGLTYRLFQLIPLTYWQHSHMSTANFGISRRALTASTWGWAPGCSAHSIDSMQSPSAPPASNGRQRSPKKVFACTRANCKSDRMNPTTRCTATSPATRDTQVLRSFAPKSDRCSSIARRTRMGFPARHHDDVEGGRAVAS